MNIRSLVRGTIGRISRKTSSRRSPPSQVGGGDQAAHEHACSGKHLRAFELGEKLEQAGANGERPDLRGRCLHDETLSDVHNLSKLRLDRCNLQGANLVGCDLSNTSLTHANLKDVNLTNAILVETNLERASLTRANLTRADLTSARFDGSILRGADLSQAVLHKTHLRVDSLDRYLKQEREGDYLGAQAIYLALKENFQSIGLYDAASWAYLRERIAERHTFAPSRARDCYLSNYHYDESLPQGNREQAACTYPRSVACGLTSRREYLLFWARHWYWWKWFSGIAQEYIWGYGQRPERVLGVCLVTIPLFSFLYFVDGGLQASQGGSVGLVELLLYSLAAFATGTIPDINAASITAQLLSSIEGIVGVTTFALFTTALAQRMGGR